MRVETRTLDSSREPRNGPGVQGCEYPASPSLRRSGSLADRLLIAGRAAHHQVRDLPLGVLHELEAGRIRRRHELRFRLLEERKLRLVEAAHEQHIAGC